MESEYDIYGCFHNTWHHHIIIIDIYLLAETLASIIITVKLSFSINNGV